MSVLRPIKQPLPPPSPFRGTPFYPGTLSLLAPFLPAPKSPLPLSRSRPSSSPSLIPPPHSQPPSPIPPHVLPLPASNPPPLSLHLLSRASIIDLLHPPSSSLPSIPTTSNNPLHDPVSESVHLKRNSKSLTQGLRYAGPTTLVAVGLPASSCGLESVVRDWHRNGNLKGSTWGERRQKCVAKELEMLLVK
ncbi:hypothetical protein E2C01_041515 [Portunus trituberculatus]|uniref:Uncharacterized protein n=1 Tax=Portunus trituberculatus TaxID=210409 RepID=A0A5B7FS35_PORTR|nr:hypothetical protein [Portunus trituberculatus]